MKRIVELLLDEIRRSSYHTAMGLPLGEDYPEIVREIIENPHISTILLTDLMGTIHQMDGVIEARDNNADIISVTKMPAVSGAAMRWLYWGIQLGRQLAKQESQVLSSLENEKF